MLWNSISDNFYKLILFQFGESYYGFLIYLTSPGEIHLIATKTFWKVWPTYTLTVKINIDLKKFTQCNITNFNPKHPSKKK